MLQKALNQAIKDMGMDKVKHLYLDPNFVKLC